MGSTVHNFYIAPKKVPPEGSPKVLELISLGAGDQSTTMALMAAKGEITPMPDAAIFADTGGEPQHVYDHLEQLIPQLPFPVHKVKAAGGSLEEVSLRVRTSKKTGNRYTKSLIPAHIDGAGLMGRRCTKDFKITPLRKKARELAGIVGKQTKVLRVRQWIGISQDEIQRMRSSDELWVEIVHPLVDLRMTRQDCLRWMELNGYPEPPRSSCVWCPFHDLTEWSRLSKMPREWARIVKFEKDLQAAAEQNTGSAKLSGLPYLHPDRIPIDEIDFDVPDKQMDFGFLNECGGMCGV